MKTRAIMLVIFMIAVMLSGTAFALPVGKTRVFPNKMGSVVINGDTHKASGVGCKDCHKELFKMVVGALTMPVPHEIGVSCGACHDGNKAFSINSACDNCHRI